MARQAESISCDDVAGLGVSLGLAVRFFGQRMNTWPCAREDVRSWLSDVEDDHIRANSLQLMFLRIAFEFSPRTYRRLCAEADAAPSTDNERIARHG